MKNIYNPVLMVVILLLCSTCKKEHQNTSNQSQSFTPAFIPLTSAGYVSLSTSHVIVKLGEQANVTAVLFQSNGDLYSPQPGFVWSSNDSTVATVSAGVITPVKIGSAAISVTDGSHGIFYVGVNVISSDSTVPSGAVSISFSRPTLVLKTNQSSSVNYTITDRLCATLGGNASLFSDPNNGLTFSGNTITAGSKTGNFLVNAALGNDTLNGSLLVVVYNPAGGALQSWSSIVHVRHPMNFSTINLTAEAVRVDVAQTTVQQSGAISVLRFQTSPDQVTIQYPSVVTIDGNGLMTSVGEGITSVQYICRGSSFTGYSATWFNILGSSWQGDNCGICVAGSTPNTISYNDNVFAGVNYLPNPLGQFKFLTCDSGNLMTSGGISFPYTSQDMHGQEFAWFGSTSGFGPATTTLPTGIIANYSPGCGLNYAVNYKDHNDITLQLGSQKYTLARTNSSSACSSSSQCDMPNTVCFDTITMSNCSIYGGSCGWNNGGEGFNCSNGITAYIYGLITQQQDIDVYIITNTTNDGTYSLQNVFSNPNCPSLPVAVFCPLDSSIFPITHGAYCYSINGSYTKSGNTITFNSTMGLGFNQNITHIVSGVIKCQ